MKTALVVLLLAAAPAAAQPTIEVVPTCVTAEGEQRALLVRALERLDLLIVETGCQDTITLTEEIDGAKVILRLTNATSKRKLTIAATDDRSEAYTRMAKSLLEPAPEPAPVVSPIEEYPRETPALVTPAVPQIDELPTETQVMRSAFYAMAGFGTGGAFTFGYRTGDRTKFDLGMQVIAEDDDDSGTKMTTLAMRAQIIRVSNPGASSTFYAGGGLSLASSERDMAGSTAEQSGLRIESTLGFELGRTNSRVFYIEASGALPLYNVGGDYPITFVVSAGAGL